MTARYGMARRARQGWLAGFAATVLLLSPVMTAQAEPARLLILGDSLTAGYGLPASEGFQAQLKAALASRGIAVTLVDAAVSGDTSAGGRARLDWSIGPGVDAAIVELGANDGLRGLDPAEMEKNLTAILDDLTSKHVKILLSGMYAPTNYGAHYGTSFRAVFDRLSRRAGVLWDPFFLQDVGGDRSLLQADGLHPNAAGVARIVARLLPLVMTLLKEAGPS